MHAGVCLRVFGPFDWTVDGRGGCHERGWVARLRARLINPACLGGNSIPDVPFVEGDAMVSKETAELVLKRFSAVVFLLKLEGILAGGFQTPGRCESGADGAPSGPGTILRPHGRSVWPGRRSVTCWIGVPHQQRASSFTDQTSDLRGAMPLGRAMALEIRAGLADGCAHWKAALGSNGLLAAKLAGSGNDRLNRFMKKVSIDSRS